MPACPRTRSHQSQTWPCLPASLPSSGAKPALTLSKCDEGKPACNKCTSYGVSCSYDAGASEMHVSFAGTLSMNLAKDMPQQALQRIPRITLDLNMLLPVAGKTGPPSYKLSSRDWEFMHIFQSRTIFTMGDEGEADVYKTRTMDVAVQVGHALINFANLD